MNLWIRSQDKSSIVKVDNLYVSVGNYICYYVEKGKEVPDTYYRPSGELGRYETKERALEVLDEIQNILISKHMISLDYKNALCSNFTYKQLQEVLKETSVYQMPEK